MSSLTLRAGAVLLLAGLAACLSLVTTASSHDEVVTYIMEDKFGNPMRIVLSGEYPEHPRPVDLRDDVIFLLYTRDNDENGVRIYINDTATVTHFAPTKPTKILIHGFTGNVSSASVQLLRAAYFATGCDCNIIAVDWGALCPPPYYNVAKTNALLVGAYVGDLVNFLVSEGTPLSSIHLIGHSLGGQVVGVAGHGVAGGKRVARITGLDPSRRLFELETADHRLDATDAILVDVIHTDGQSHIVQPIGHIDFYPNGGRTPQPGCGADVRGACSHRVSYIWYAQSIGDVTRFPARACATLADAMTGTCDHEDTGFMGDNLRDT